MIGLMRNSEDSEAEVVRRLQMPMLLPDRVDNMSVRAQFLTGLIILFILLLLPVFRLCACVL